MGGNLGDKVSAFVDALSLIEKRIGDIKSASSLYETEPWGFKHENWFLNQAVMISSELSPMEVLIKIHGIEKVLGRKRNEKQYAGRNIDIDILFADEEIFYREELIIPHKRIHERKFALIPLMEIAPDLRHPLLEITVSELVQECKDKMKVNLFKSVTAGKKRGNLDQ